MSDAMHATARHAMTIAAVVFVFFFVFFSAMAHFFPAHTVTNGPVARSTASPVEREAQAVIEATKVLAALKGGVPSYAQPAVSIIREVAPGFSPAQINAILGALKPKTAQVVRVDSHLSGPTPAPLPSAVPGLTDAEIAAIYGADKSAIASVLADPNTKIATSVKITQEEVPVSRVGSLLTPIGSGIDIAIYRHRQFDIDLGAIQRAAHLSPVVCPAYNVPRTTLSVGPCLVFDHGAHPTIGASIKF